MEQASDATFFDMVHALVAQPEEDGAERRADQRHAYQCIQWVAPYDGEHLPAQSDFCKVRCEDLSTKGFSFYSDKIPESKYVVVALGTVPFMFYTAEVLHSRPFTRDERVEYLVGCRLQQRLTR